MSQLLPFIVSGIASGSIFGLAGAGLLLTYKTSGILNFGHGAVATVAAYLFYALHEQLGWGWFAALLMSVGVAGPLIGFVMELIARSLATQRVAMQVVGTVGVVLLVQGLATTFYDVNTIRMAQWLPGGTNTVRIGGAVVSWDQLIIIGIALVAVGALFALFRFSRTGLAMRAVVDDPDLLSLRTTDPQRVRRFAWVIGSTFAALCGVLIAPLTGLDAIGLTFLVVQAFGAAALGAFNSIPGTFFGGIAIGVVSDVSKSFVIEAPWLAGLPTALPFLVLLVGLLVIPKRRLMFAARPEKRPPTQYRAPARVRIVAGVAVLVVLALIPQIVPTTKLSFWLVGLVTAILLLSLGLLVRVSGQVSLSHVTFAAIGAVAFSQFHVDLGLPWVVSLLLGALVVVPVGALLALPAIRLSGIYLALATFGFGLLVQQLLYSQSFMFTRLEEGRRMPRPDFAKSVPDFYYVVLVVLVVVAVGVVLVQRSRLGRMLQGMSDSPTAVTAMGLSINLTKVIVFCISAFFAGLAGVLLGVARLFATGGDPMFQPFFSLQLLAQLALAPFAEPWYALMALANVIPGYIPGAATHHIISALFGFFAIVIAVQGGTPPAPAWLRNTLDRLGGVKREERPDPDAAPLKARESSGVGVQVRDLSVHFGGLAAVQGVSFSAPAGRITGMIGPNGAGKTTTFNACSGLNRRFDGQVLLHDEDITSLAPATRGRRGLGRTFQRMELCENLTVLENVVLGRECSQAGNRLLGQLRASRAQRRESVAVAWSAMELCGITELAGRKAGELTTGQRRLVELARCLAGPFDVLLLDEPSSGLDSEETARFGRLLQQVVQERGIGILLVEHDMDLVMRVCSYIYVLDFGQMVFEGTPSEVMNSPVVQAAYLGSEAGLDELKEPETT